ncbi:hypothetical protein SDC9_87191 [bioreactor metagenome]|uniref:Uncharacterized protein n=1 Tax=bioreactor metagenome TaxID=1076179 RepID=A0A644ZIJ6_9ZZZZ
MNVKAFLVEYVSFHLIGMGRNQGKARNQLNALAEHILKGIVIGIVVIGIKSQRAASQLIHNVFTGCTDDHVLCEIFRQLTAFGQN